MKTWSLRATACALLAFLADPALAVNIATVPVGDPGNTGELSGAGVGGFGPDRVCGAVGYEYNIGKYEVTAGQYTEFLNAVARTDTYGLYNADMVNTRYGSGISRSGSPGNYTYTANSAFVNRPVNYVSWGDSARFANWLHNGQPTGAQGPTTTEDGSYRLNGATTYTDLMAVTRNPNASWVIPSEDEWYKAAYYKGGSTNAGYWGYAPGGDTAPGQDKADASGNNANYWTAPYAHPLDPPYYTTAVGEFQNSDSPYGTFDQSGNVTEWNESALSDSYRVIRGGSFLNDAAVYVHSSNRGGYYPTYEFDSIGFRVCEVPDPATLSLLALAAAGLLAKRRRQVV